MSINWHMDKHGRSMQWNTICQLKRNPVYIKQVVTPQSLEIINLFYLFGFAYFGHFIYMNSNNI
jgi:hypothetical protein